MTVNELLKELWQLPWYKSLYVSVIDDFMTFIKLWWIWVGMIILSISLAGLKIYFKKR